MCISCKPVNIFFNFPYLQERFWEQCIFKYLRAEPEDHYFLLVSFI